MNKGVFMTIKETDRFEVFLRVKNKQLTQTDAAREIQLSLRHTQRLFQSFKKEGVNALDSKKRGKSSNNQLNPIIKARIVEIISIPLYAGFKPTFMCEIIERKHQIKISKETMRQLMIEEGLWIAKEKKCPAIHQQRQRKARAGELIQIDGSPHLWFEERGPRCTLIVFIDDATGRIHCKFAETETTRAYMETAMEYLNKYGRPLAFYSDRHAIFRVNIPNNNKKEQQTQFGRALKELDIRLLCANSPQAKGRVERANKTLQDRLIKEMRMRSISTIEAANQFLNEVYIEEFNEKFAIEPGSKEDAHRVIEKGMDLSRILCEKQVRKVSKNLEFQFNNIIYQIKLENPPRSLIGAAVTILKKMDGEILVEYGGKKLQVVEYFKQPYVGEIVHSKEIEFIGQRKLARASWHHPWRQQGRAEVKKRQFYHTKSDETGSSGRIR